MNESFDRESSKKNLQKKAALESEANEELRKSLLRRVTRVLKDKFSEGGFEIYYL